MAYKTLAEIKAANQAAGQHWFDQETMDWWGTRVRGPIYPSQDGAYFVTGERPTPEDTRRYTVRYADASGRVISHDDYAAYPTSGAARRRAQQLAASGYRPRMPTMSDVPA